MRLPSDYVYRSSKDQWTTFTVFPRVPKLVLPEFSHTTSVIINERGTVVR